MRGILGTVIIGATYLATYMVTTFVLHFIRPAPEGLSSSWSQPLAITLSTVPYAVGGVYATWAWKTRTRWHPAPLGLTTALMERAIILGGGYLTFLAYAGMPKSPDVLGFIQREAAPYFTTTYIVAGLVISPLVTTVAAWLMTAFRRDLR